MTRRTGADLCDPAARLAGEAGLADLKMTGFFSAAVPDGDWDSLPTRAPPMEDNWVTFPPCSNSDESQH